MSRPTVLILGAAGRFGSAATAAFAQAGWRVLAQQRKAPSQPLPAGVERIDTPLADTAGLAARARGTTAVVYAVNPIYTRWDAELLPLFQQGLAVAERLGARLMLPGNVYAYGATMPTLLSESTPARPDTRKGELRQAMEDELQRRAASGLDSVILRAGDFFGCGSGSWLDQAIVKDIARGKLVYPGPLDRVHAWAYLPDLAHAFVAVAQATPAKGCQQLHVAGHAVTGRDFIAALEEAAASLGLRPAAGFKVGGMPWPLIGLIGLVNPMLRELWRMRWLWTTPHTLDGRALQKRVGALPATPLVTALRQSLLDLGLGGSPMRQPASA